MATQLAPILYDPWGQPAKSSDYQIKVDDDDDDDEIPAAPQTQEFRELPVYGTPPPDRVYTVEKILAELEKGIFRNAALLIDAMLRDDRVNGVMTTRIHALLGSVLEWLTPDDDESAQAKDIRDEVEDSFELMCGHAELAELMRWSTLLGVGVGELIWDDKGPERWRCRLKVWHPQFLYWRWDTRSYWVVTENTGSIEVTPGDGKWIVHTPYGYNYAWLRGLIRSLAKPWLIRNWAYRDGARWSEVHSLGIRCLVAPADANEKDKKRLESQLANIGNETQVTLPQGKDGNKWDLKIVEAQAAGYEAIFKLLHECDESIAINVLGQNLTTEVKGGSRAAAQVHDQVRGDIMSFDAKALSHTIRDQILEPWCKFNFGDPELAPVPQWMTEPPDDGKALAEELVSLSQAMQTFVSLGAPVDIRALLEAHNVPMLEEGEELQIEKPEPPPAPPGQPPQDGGDGNQPPPKPETKSLSLSARPQKRAHIKGQRYADALTKQAKRRAQEAMARDRKGLMDDILAAKSYRDLHERVLVRFSRMNPHELAQVIEKTKIMAELAGRHTLLEDV